jgi:hypothetical protein
MKYYQVEMRYKKGTYNLMGSPFTKLKKARAKKAEIEKISGCKCRIVKTKISVVE